jgi:hypothetical protein
LNFFMADMQAGIGPFLGVFLLAHGWQSGLIGSVMTIGGVAGMVMTGPSLDGTHLSAPRFVIAGEPPVYARNLGGSRFQAAEEFSLRLLVSYR